MSSVFLTGISMVMELFANSDEIMFHVQNIPSKISGVVSHIALICSNPISPIKEAYMNFKGVKVLIKTTICSPIRRLQAFFSKSLSPIIMQGVEVIMVGYENLIYTDIILPILSVIESVVRIVECVDVSQLITPELKQFYNSVAKVLGIGTMFNVLMQCAYVKSLEGVKEVCNLFINMISKVFDSIKDIFDQMINIVNWLVDSTKNSSESLQLKIENLEEINLDE